MRKSKKKKTGGGEKTARSSEGRSSSRSARGRRGRDESSGRPQSQNRSQGGPQSSLQGRSRNRSREGTGNTLEGIVKRHPDGFGFFIPDAKDHPDVYLPRHSMAGVMTNDRVEVEVFPARRDDRFFGEVKSVIQRATKTVVGRIRWLDERAAIVMDDSKSWGADLKILKEFSQGASDGQLVAAEITAYPGPHGDFMGRVSSILGSAEDPLNDIHRVLATHQLPQGFSSKAMAQAEAWGGKVREEDKKDRVDLRDLPLITIDGVTAKDFDDAVYVKKTPKGFTVYVGIADVSHYVPADSILDDEAYEKGNSTYFPGFVVPMLPEVLSNNLCSLNPHVDRLAVVAEMHLDFSGSVETTRIYEAVIQSKARVTYGEAQEVLDGETPESLKHVENEIKIAGDLAKILMKKRFEEGSLDLEIPATEVLINSDGIPTDIIKSERIFAHRLVEELMLLANVAVATFLISKNQPAIFRIHEPPDRDALEILQKYLYTFGSSSKISGGIIQKKITQALQGFSDRPEAQVLNILTLRSMSQAKYSADNVGHFGLNFEKYTHFTSPIRRYADLVVHRLLKAHLYPKKGYGLISQDKLQTVSTWISSCEQRSVKAERNLVSIKKARFMSSFLGQEFEGVISSVAKFGVFVLLRAFDIDGLIRAEELGDDKFIFDEENLIMFGKRTGVSFKVGDFVKVQVAAADVEEGRIDFKLVTEGGDNELDNQPPENRSNAKKRRSNKRNR